MRAEEKRLFLAGLLLGLLLSRALRALLSTLFYESLVTLRLNGTAAWTLVLLAPLVAAALRAHPRAPLLVGALASAALPLARFTDAYVPVAAVATGTLLFGVALLGRALAAVLAGLALDAALLLLGRGHDVTLEGAGIWLAALAAAALVAAVWRSDPPPGDLPASPMPGLAGVGLAALFAVEWAFLASPYAAARWHGLPAWGAAFASLFGLVVGATRLRRAGAWLYAAGALALVDVALVRSPFAPLSLALAQASLGAAGARLGPALGRAWGAGAFGAALAGLLFVLLFFRSPLGLSEWGVVVPGLALVALLAALPAPRPVRAPRAAGGLASALVVALVLVAALAPTAMAPPPEGRELRVASWNVHQAFGNRGALDPGIYAEVLRGLDPDIVVLQESDTARLSSGGVDIVAYLAHALGMEAAYGRSGVAILTRLPLAQAEPLDQTRDREWFLEAGLATSNGTLWIHGVHLGRDRALRMEQAQEILDAAALREGPKILAGDFNSCPTGACFGGRPSEPVYDTLTARYTDAWVAAGHDRADPAGNTHPTRAPSRRIDLVLVEGLEVLESGPVLDERTRLASDHLPNFAILRLPE